MDETKVKLLQRIISIALVVVTGLGAAVFLLSNREPVAVDFVLGSISLSAGAWIVLAFIVGGLCGLFACSGLLLRLGRARVSASRQARQYEKEVSKLRTAAYKD